jgi:hypothetical protein
VTKEDVMAAIRDCAETLGHVPSSPELYKTKNLTISAIRRTFGTYTKALHACGMEPAAGIQFSLEELFRDWAGIVRRTGTIPTMAEYGLHSKYSMRPLRHRFGTWSNVPRGLLQYAEQNGLENQWGDVLDVIRRHCDFKSASGTSRSTSGSTSGSSSGSPAKPRILPGRPVYGPLLLPAGLAHGPVNEAGVVYLFGMLAGKLGFLVTWIGTEFPDCEAVREVEPGRWQRVRIEFEYESRNFLRHLHQAEECDLIVCWQHNWPECPLEVVELKEKVSGRV